MKNAFGRGLKGWSLTTGLKGGFDCSWNNQASGLGNLIGDLSVTLTLRSRSWYAISFQVALTGRKHCRSHISSLILSKLDSRPSHTCSIERMYGDIVDALQTAGNFLTVQKQKSFKQIPGWNEVCMNLHHEARESFLVWKANAKPRTGPIHELMKISKTKFKYGLSTGLRQCNKDAASHVNNKLAHSLLTKDSKAFWKGIKSISNKDEYHAAEAACQTTTVTDVTVIQDGDCQLLA